MTPDNARRPELDEFEARKELIRDTERTRLAALVRADAATALPLHAEDFQLITPIGAALTREQYLGAIATGQIDYHLWQPRQIEVRLNGDTACIRYQAELEVTFGGHRVPRANYWHTDSYQLREAGWQAVWSQATQIR